MIDTPLFIKKEEEEEDDKKKVSKIKKEEIDVEHPVNVVESDDNIIDEHFGNENNEEPNDESIVSSCEDNDTISLDVHNDELSEIEMETYIEPLYSEEIVDPVDNNIEQITSSTRMSNSNHFNLRGHIGNTE